MGQKGPYEFMLESLAQVTNPLLKSKAGATSCPKQMASQENQYSLQNQNRTTHSPIICLSLKGSCSGMMVVPGIATPSRAPESCASLTELAWRPTMNWMPREMTAWAVAAVDLYKVSTSLEFCSPYNLLLCWCIFRFLYKRCQQTWNHFLN